MKKGGTGGDLTRTGLVFEKATDLKTALSSVKGYSVNEEGRVIVHGHDVGGLYPQHKFYSSFLTPRGVNWKNHISAKLLPDEALCLDKSKRVFIVEKKWQQCSGSVDEKLQTCDFKMKQYNKLVKPIGYSAHFLFLLSDWFQKPQYGDVLEYIDQVGCKYFFGEIPLGYFFSEDLRPPTP